MLNKNDTLISLDEANAIIQEYKETVKPIEWVAKIESMTLPWLTYQTSCRVNSEIREDIMFITQYRQSRVEIKGAATINIPEQFTASLNVGRHRIIALDTNNKSHTNNVGVGLPFYKQRILSRTHVHIWTPEGYGYVEPVEPPLNDYEALVKDFLIRANINLIGGFEHPLKYQTRPLI